MTPEQIRKMLGPSKSVSIQASGPAKDRDGRTYKPFVFKNPISRGDCTVVGGATLKLYSDGGTSWECFLSSMDPGDEWDGVFLGGLAGFDTNNVDTYDKLLFVTPTYHYDIHDINTLKHWNESHGPNDNQYANGSNGPEAYARTVWVYFSCSC
jgi:hypothetical protein